MRADQIRAVAASRLAAATFFWGDPGEHADAIGPMPLGEAGSGVGLRLGGPLPPRVGTSHLGEDLKL